MSKSSIHIANGGSGYIAHNARETFSQSQVFYDEKNEIWNNKEKAFKLFRFELAARSDAYSKRTKQKLQKKSITHLSAIVNLEQHHTLEDLKPLAKYLEDELDTKMFQVAIHRDEGKLVHKETAKTLTSGEQFFSNPKNKKLYFDKNFENEIDLSEWKLEKNYHAHFEFMGLDQEGKSIRRKFNNHFFRKLQDFTAKTLEMERGNESPSYSKEEMKEIRTKVNADGYSAKDKEYGKKFIEVAKELGYWKPKPNHKKRKDTHDYKAEKAKENEANAKAIATQKSLKEDIAKLRKQLQEQGAVRKQYAELEQLNKDLKAKIKNKDLTLEQMKQQIDQLNVNLWAKDTKIKAVEKQNQALKDKIDTLPSSDTLEELKTLKNDFEELQTENAELWELAYEEDYETVLDMYGLPHDKTFTYKERYEQSLVKIEELEKEIRDSDDYITKLDKGYEEIEKIVFGEAKERKVEEVIKGVSLMRDVIINVSKYLEIGVKNIVGLFKKGVPNSKEVEEAQPKKKIEPIVLPESKSMSAPKIKLR